MIKKLIFLLCLYVIPAYSQIDDRKFLNCIANVETGNCYWSISSSGARSQYQFLRDTWYDYSTVQFGIASEKEGQEEVERVARLHLDRIKRFLVKHKYQVNVTNCSLIWCAGMGNFRKNKLTGANRDYAIRVNNLYLSYQ